MGITVGRTKTMLEADGEALPVKVERADRIKRDKSRTELNR